MADDFEPDDFTPEAVDVTTPAATRDDFTADDFEPEAGGSAEQPNVAIPGPLEQARVLIREHRERSKAEALVKQHFDEQMKAEAAAKDADPRNWSSTRFKKEMPKPRTPQEQGFYDATLADIKSKEKGFADKVATELFGRPGAASREAIRGAVDPNETAAAGYVRGATKPEESQTFQEQFSKNASEASNKMVADMEKTLGIELGGGDLEVAVRTISGMQPAVAAAIAGSVADGLVNPAEVLLTILGGKALKYIAKIPAGARTLGERAGAPLRELFTNKPAAANEAASSVMSYVNKQGEKIYTRLSGEELAKFKDEVANIPAAEPGSAQIHLDADTPALQRGGREVSREEFISGHPQAGAVLGRPKPAAAAASFENEEISDLIRKASGGEGGFAGTGKGTTSEVFAKRGIISKEEQRAAQTELLRRAQAAGASSAAEVKDFLTKAGMTNEAAERLLSGSGTPPIKPPSTSGAAPEEPSGFSGNINLGRLQTSKEAEQYLKESAKKYAERLEHQRRGTISHEETAETAKQLGMTPQELMKTRRGKAMNAEEAVAARDLLKQETEKLIEIQKKIQSGDNSDATLEAFRQQLIAQSSVQRAVSGITSEAGRALSSFRIIASTERAGLSRAALTQSQITEALEGREITQSIANRMANIDLKDEGAVNRFIRDVSRAKTSDQVYFYWLNSILSNPVTHVVNTTSNLVRSMINPIYRAAGATLEAPKRLVGGKPEIYFGEVGSEVIGKLAGMKEGARRFIYTMKNGLTKDQASKLDFRPTPIPGKVGEVVGLPTRALSAEDEFFKASISQGELHALAYREAAKQGKKGAEFWRTVSDLIKNPTDDMVEKTTEAATRQTFQDPLGQAGSSYINFRNKTWLKWITPFVKTPVNITKEAVRGSPAGLVTSKNSMERGQAVVGTAIAYYFAQAAMENRLTGAAPRDEAARKRFFAEGKKPYSIRFGDKWFSYQRIEPFATPIGLIADGWRLWNEKDLKEAGAGEIAGEAARLLGKNAIDKTFMQGLNNMINAIEEPGRYGERFVSSYASGMVPFSSLVRGASNAADDTVRDPNSITENIKAGLPWASKTIRPKLDSFGQPVKKPGSAVERFISPVQSSDASKDPIVNELSRLDITIPSSGQSQGGVKLTDDEYFSFMQEKGRNVRAELESFMKHPGYAAMDDADKRAYIEKFLSSDKANPKEISKRAGERVYDEISAKLAPLGTPEERRDEIYKLLKRRKISTGIANRLLREFA